MLRIFRRDVDGAVPYKQNIRLFRFPHRKNPPAPWSRGIQILVQMSLVDENMHIIQLLLGNSGGGIHHQILCGLAERCISIGQLDVALP